MEAFVFKQELDFFQKNQEKLVDQYKGKVLVIKGSELIGAYRSPLEAFTEASKKYEPGSFMIQPCNPGPDAYTVTINALGMIKTKA
jgi:alanine dehydrogenase